MKAQDNDIPKLKQSTVERHEVKEEISFNEKVIRLREKIEAIAFAEWVAQECVRTSDKEDLKYFYYDKNTDTTDEYSIPQLYQLFKDSTK